MVPLLDLTELLVTRALLCFGQMYHCKQQLTSKEGFEECNKPPEVVTKKKTSIA
jgi:hypothetical protein